MKHYRHLLSRLLIESILIVVSVLVALMVNDWKIGRENEARAVEARNAFISEIATNRALLDSDTALRYHEHLQKVYAQAIASSAPDPKTLFETGLHPVNFTDAAWRAFSGTTIFADFPVNHVLILSDIYHQQTEIERRTDSLLVALTSPRADRDTPAYQRDSALSIALFLNDLVPAEQRLLKQYDQVLQQLRSRQ
jgi:hypothetical protein